MKRKRLDRLPDSTRNRVLQRDWEECIYCGSYADTVDHVVPYSYSLNSREENLAASCLECNLIAGSRVFNSFEEKKEYILQRRNSRKWKKKLMKKVCRCTVCHERYLEGSKDSTKFICPTCNKNDIQYREEILY